MGNGVPGSGGPESPYRILGHQVFAFRGPSNFVLLGFGALGLLSVQSKGVLYGLEENL